MVFLFKINAYYLKKKKTLHYVFEKKKSTNNNFHLSHKNILYQTYYIF